jgi:tetratricopeptide (TPR) repeat protein
VGRKAWFGAITMVAALLCSVADAQIVSTDFSSCDGYDAPRGERDGISDVGGFWTGPGDRVRHVPSNFTLGIESCTRALRALDSQFPSAWMRRVSVLQARALHRLIANDAAGALTDLDLADQAAVEPQDPFYLRSVSINTNLIRALALAQNGDRPGAEALAMATWERRSYSREVIGAAALIIGSDGSMENTDRLLRAAAQLDPSYSDYVFRYKFETGRFEEALAHYADIVAPVAARDQSFRDTLRDTVQYEEQQRVRTVLFLLGVAGQKAYALAALGRANEARATLAQLNGRLAASTPEPLSALPNTPDYVRLVVRQRANDEIRRRGPVIRDAWAGMVEARIAAGEGRAEEARATLDALTSIPPSYAVIDLMTASGADAASVESARRALPSTRFGFPARDGRTLFAILLDAESRGRAASRMNMFDAAFTSRSYRDRGGCEEQRHFDGAVNVCYKGFDATLAVTEERALLRVAARAAEHGGRFRIERRDDIQHSVVSTMYGRQIGDERQNGFETSLTVRFFQEGAPCGRCINAADVQAALGDIYAQALGRQPE